MRGCLVFVVGVVVGAVLVVVLQLATPLASPRPNPPAGNVDLDILVHDQLLTRELQTQLAGNQGNVSFSSLTVQTEPGNSVIVNGKATLAATSVSAPVRVVMRPSVVQNRISLDVSQADVGSLKLPGTLFRSLEGPINNQLTRSLASNSYHLEGVSTTADGLLISVSIPK
jgi:uncharacterized protein YpmS